MAGSFSFADTLNGTGGNLSTTVQTAYDRLLEFALRAQPLFRTLADKKPAQQAMPGSSVVFQLYNDLTKATTALTETADVSPVAIPATSSVTVTLNEYGNAVITTRKLRLFALTDVDPAVADMVAWNMADSVDEIVQTELRNTTNIVREAGGSLSTSAAITAVTATDFLKARDVRYAVTKLRANKVVPRKGNLYAVYLHPEVALDLRTETGQGGWRQPHEYSAPDAIWAGEIGAFEGAFFVESPRCYNAVDGGTGGNTVRVFRTFVAGRQALAEAVAEEFHTVFGPVTDYLMRLRPVGWYGVAGWKLYRAASLYQIQTTSSIDIN